MFHCNTPILTIWVLLKLPFKQRTALSTIGRGSTPYWWSSTLKSRDADNCSPSRSWIAVGSSVEDIRSGHPQNKCASWETDFIHLKLFTNCWLGWGRIQSKSFMCQNFLDLRKRTLHTCFCFGRFLIIRGNFAYKKSIPTSVDSCFCFGRFLIIWGNLFVPEVKPNFGWFFSLKELGHCPPNVPIRLQIWSDSMYASGFWSYSECIGITSHPRTTKGLVSESWTLLSCFWLFDTWRLQTSLSLSIFSWLSDTWHFSWTRNDFRSTWSSHPCCHPSHGWNDFHTPWQLFFDWDYWLFTDVKWACCRLKIDCINRN